MPLRLGVVGVICAALCLAIPTFALADTVTGGLPPIPPGLTPAASVATGPAGSTASGPGGTTTSAATSAPAPAPPPTAPVPAAITKRCTWSKQHHRGTRVCRYFQSGKLIRKCVKKAGQAQVCTAEAADVHGMARTAGTAVQSGFFTPTSNAIVKIFWSFTNPASGERFTSQCSGAMIAVGLVLTAGHCVYSNAVDGQHETGFVGYYDPSTYTVVPGETLVNGQPSGPYGAWQVKNMWTTNNYSNSGMVGGDWGIIELSPNSSGTYPGAYVGEYRAEWNVPSITQLTSIGYPVDGAFSEPQNGGGLLQFYCENTLTSADFVTDPAYFGGYTAMVLQLCQETGGASGGPVFAENGGRLVIVGVNNRGAPLATSTAFGTEMLSFYFDDGFGTFWNSVIGFVNAGQ